MSGFTTVTIIVAIVVVAGVVVIGVMAALRRRRLQHRFGPEYDRLVGDRDSKLKAEAELTGRERRVRDLDIRPLTESARAGYADQWAAIQAQFVDAPEDAVSASAVLVVAVMGERGYPADDHDQILADLSVEHAGSLVRYRSAELTSESAASGSTSTEDLRLAMIDYRALFRDLLGGPGDSGNGMAAGPALAVERDDHAADGDDHAAVGAAEDHAADGDAHDHTAYGTAEDHSADGAADVVLPDRDADVVLPDRDDAQIAETPRLVAVGDLSADQPRLLLNGSAGAEAAT